MPRSQSSVQVVNESSVEWSTIVEEKKKEERRALVLLLFFRGADDTLAGVFM
jgi:hypothetical protein